MTSSSRFSILLCTGLFLLLGPTAHAQPATPVDTFDLVLMGDSLSSAHRVDLKTNPTAGGTWTKRTEVRCTETKGVMVVPTQPVDRFLGQDIRENYLALRIRAQTTGGSLRAAYALPSIEHMDDRTCSRLARLIQTKPMVVRRHSLAVYERPRPAPLRPGTPFIDHIEAPVRHRKPGVMEVEWLEILFRPSR